MLLFAHVWLVGSVRRIDYVVRSFALPYALQFCILWFLYHVTEKEHEADAVLAKYAELEEALAAAQEAAAAAELRWQEATAELERTAAQAEEAEESYAKLRSKLDKYGARKQELEARCAALAEKASQVKHIGAWSHRHT